MRRAAFFFPVILPRGKKTLGLDYVLSLARVAMPGWCALRRWIRLQLTRAAEALRPRPDPELTRTIGMLNDSLNEMTRREQLRQSDAGELAAEMLEVKLMTGAGPWQGMQPAALMESAKRESVALKESFGGEGLFSDVALAFENRDWLRLGNFARLEFSRWGIQGIIMRARYAYLRDPLIQRGVNISAAYVFGRGVEVTTQDDGANETLKEFFEANEKTLGQAALVGLQKRNHYDGQVFFIFFPDTQNTGTVKARTIDATEILDVVTNPDDTDEPWFYKRTWTQRNFDPVTGSVRTESLTRWYPALNYEPDAKPQTIDNQPVEWDTPVLHMKGGQSVSKWHFDVPRVFAALPWAKAASRFLEACATTEQALAQFALNITTKGGQQAMQGIKGQLQTTVATSPGQPAWDRNPPAGKGSTFLSGPGTTIEAFDTKGGSNPEKVRRFIHFVAIVFGIPETFFADASTGSLATAQSLDRPTELVFLEIQEQWRECLTQIAKYVLAVSKGAASGKFRASLEARKLDLDSIRIVECARRTRPDGRKVYVTEKPADANSGVVKIRVNFPAIREGDVPANVIAIVDAMTLQNRGGQIVGIDEKVGCRLLYEQLGYEESEEILELQFPDETYDPDRTKVVEPPPIPTAPPTDPGGKPQLPGGKDPAPPAKAAKESAQRLKLAIDDYSEYLAVDLGSATSVE